MLPFYPHQSAMSKSQPLAQCCTPDDEVVVMSSTGTPFEITGFRTEKFDNHDEDASRVDSLSDSPAIEKAFRIFSGRNNS